jgi:SMC interacting uncharacterized protein involved in chromosome segregation
MSNEKAFNATRVNRAFGMLDEVKIMVSDEVNSLINENADLKEKLKSSEALVVSLTESGKSKDEEIQSLKIENMGLEPYKKEAMDRAAIASAAVISNITRASSNSEYPECDTGCVEQ